MSCRVRNAREIEPLPPPLDDISAGCRGAPGRLRP